MRETGITMDQEKKPNMFKMFGLTIFYGFLTTFVIWPLVIHQAGVYSAAMGIEGVDPSIFDNFIDAYGGTYRTFKHGAFHGFIGGLFFALPVVGMGALYEQRSWKYVLVAGGYWVVSCMLMGGIICAWK
jgi:hypothetical protein